MKSAILGLSLILLPTAWANPPKPTHSPAEYLQITRPLTVITCLHGPAGSTEINYDVCNLPVTIKTGPGRYGPYTPTVTLHRDYDRASCAPKGAAETLECSSVSYR